MITVWGRRNSVNVQKVLWALEELDVPYTRENVGGSFGGNQDADFLSMNPMGLVPVIRDGDVTMFESNAIVRYLAARFRAGVLRPSDHKSLAMAEQWMEWTQLNMGPAVTTLFINRVRSLPEARDVAAAAAAESKVAEALRIADAWIARHDWFAGHASASVTSPWARCCGATWASTAQGRRCRTSWNGSKPFRNVNPSAAP